MRGLQHLSGLANLEYLNLYGTNITDAGLTQLTGLQHLRKIYLWQTKTTEAGITALKKAMPNLEVIGGITEQVVAQK